MVQEIRSLQKLAIFFRVSRWGRRGGGLVRGTLRYLRIIPCYNDKISESSFVKRVTKDTVRTCCTARIVYDFRYSNFTEFNLNQRKQRTLNCSSAILNSLFKLEPVLMKWACVTVGNISSSSHTLE